MTQELQKAAPPQPPDGLAQIFLDLRKERDRIRRIQDGSPKKIFGEMADTAMSYLEDAIGYFIQFRNWTAETVNDIDGRITAIEDDQPIPSLTKEDAAMLLDLAGRAESFAKIVGDHPGISADVKREVEETLVRAQQVVAWVAENVEDDEDDDGDGGEDGEEGDEDAEPVNAAGGAS
jgi:hypothetical protein